MTKEDIDKILDDIVKGLNNKYPDDTFSFECEIINFEPKYFLYKNNVKQDILISAYFIQDVFLRCYDVGELIAACIYELCRKI